MLVQSHACMHDFGLVYAVCVHVLYIYCKVGLDYVIIRAQMEYNNTHANNELKPCSWVVATYSITAGHNQLLCHCAHVCMHAHIWSTVYVK